MSGDNVKAPSQVFKWFEKMKENYDKNILIILQRLEKNNNQQQNRIDDTHRSHINTMRESYLSQTSLLTSQIEQQRQEISYFKQQIEQQQHTISQLNNRYDAVMIELISNKEPAAPFKDIFNDKDFINADNSAIDSPSINNSAIKQNTVSSPVSNIYSQSKYDDLVLDNEQEAEKMYLLALEMRDKNNTKSAFSNFINAANLGHVLAMGAVGRAYFLAEGVKENHSIGLSWLINAAELALPQAIKRVEYFRINEPLLYQEALALSKEVTNEALTASGAII